MDAPPCRHVFCLFYPDTRHHSPANWFPLDMSRFLNGGFRLDVVAPVEAFGTTTGVGTATEGAVSRAGKSDREPKTLADLRL